MTKRSVAVIGSGFGGSVMACRLAESGRFDVTVFERGPRYARNSFPRRPEQLGEMFWDPDDGHFGLFEYRSFPLRALLRRGRRSRVDVLTASGVGGGSLVYSNVLFRMPARFFETWPGDIRAETLERWYRRVEDMLEVRPYPMAERWGYRATPKSRAMAEAAAKLRADPRGGPPVILEWPNLAIRFGRDAGADITNAHGVRQGTCTMCGECNIGCNAHAKSSLDLNYLSIAERNGTRTQEWTAARGVRRLEENGKTRWRVLLADPRGGRERHADFDLVVVAAGSLGSTFLMLESRDHLGVDSPKIGTKWSPNGDLLGFVVGTTYQRQPTVGPVITGALHVDAGSYPDGFPAGAWIEDGGLPSLLVWYLLGKQGWWPGFAGMGRVMKVMAGWFGSRGGEANIGDSLARIILRDPAFLTRTMMMLGMGRDRSTGTFSLRSGPATWDRLRLAWNSGDGELHYQRTRTAMARVAEALGGRYVENPLSILNRYISVHPLGGMPIADRIEDGPIDARSGQVFGCDGLYVVDGSIIPTAVGPNPSLTIAALAEMYAARLVEQATA